MSDTEPTQTSKREPSAWDLIRGLAQSLIANPDVHEPEDDEEAERAAGREWYCPCGTKNMAGASVCENAEYGADPDEVASKILRLLPRVTESDRLKTQRDQLVAALMAWKGAVDSGRVTFVKGATGPFARLCYDTITALKDAGEVVE